MHIKCLRIIAMSRKIDVLLLLLLSLVITLKTQLYKE